MKLSMMEHNVKLKTIIKTKAPSDEGGFPHSVREMSRSDKERPPPSAAGFLRSKKTEGEIFDFLSFRRKRSSFLVRGRRTKRRLMPSFLAKSEK